MRAGANLPTKTGLGSKAGATSLHHPKTKARTVHDQTLRPRIERDGSRLRLASVDELVAAYDPTIRHYAELFHRPGLSIEELVAEGRLGLIESAKQWHTKRVRFAQQTYFTAYALCWIEASIALTAVRQHSLVRDPDVHLLTQLALQLRRADPKLAMQLRDLIVKRALDVEALPELQGDPDDLDDLLRGQRLISGLKARARPSDTPTPEERTLEQERARRLRIAVLQIWSTLSGQERFVLRRRFLATTSTPIAQVAHAMQTSEQEVTAVEEATLEKLRRCVAGYSTVHSERSDLDRPD